jgi:outer membrane protein insertion porin family
VESKISEGSSPNLKILKISVEEKATGEISAGMGIGTEGTAFLFSVKENNWLGRGMKLDSVLDITEETVAGSLAVRDPNFNYSGNAVFSSITVSTTDKSVSSSFKSNKTGFTLGTEFEQYEGIYFSPTLTAAVENIDVEATASTNIKNMAGEYMNMDFSYGITKDRRNQVFQPTEGYILKFNQSLPILQDGSSMMNGITYNSYHGFSENVIGVLRLSARAMTGVDDDVRLTSRLFIPRSLLPGINNLLVNLTSSSTPVIALADNLNTPITFSLNPW